MRLVFDVEKVTRCSQRAMRSKSNEIREQRDPRDEGELRLVNASYMRTKVWSSSKKSGKPLVMTRGKH